jgi:hypothetical protein
MLLVAYKNEGVETDKVAVKKQRTSRYKEFAEEELAHMAKELPKGLETEIAAVESRNPGFYRRFLLENFK